MARREVLTVKVRIDGIRETLAVFRYLPTEASKSLRERTLELSQALAVKVQAAGTSQGAQAALVAPTVKATKDRVPAITAGGNKKVGRKRAPAHALLFGSEFGMDRRSGWFAAERFEGSIDRQYRPHLGQGSYWFFRTVEENQDDVARAWQKVADDVQREFIRG